jgi:hypothetical protein
MGSQSRGQRRTRVTNRSSEAGPPHRPTVDGMEGGQGFESPKLYNTDTLTCFTRNGAPIMFPPRSGIGADSALKVEYRPQL